MDSQIIKVILNLSKEERLDIIDAIWLSLNEELQNSEIPEWHKNILDERINRLKTGESVFRDWEDIKKKYI